MNTLFGGAFAPPILLPLLIVGYLLSYVLASKTHTKKLDPALLLIGLTLLGWVFITVVIYGLSYLHQRGQQVVFVHLIPWYSLWLVYSGAITLGSAHAIAQQVARAALTAADPLPPLNIDDLPPSARDCLESQRHPDELPRT